MRRLLGLLLALSVAGCGGSSTPAPTEAPPVSEPPTADASTALPPPIDPVAMGPEDVLEAWLTAQESGDFGWAMTFLVSSQHSAWEQVSEEMTEDDLISSGLTFREQAYTLEFSDKAMAVFWSSSAKLYLVMVRESGQWRIHPRKTDEMNLEFQSPSGS